MKKIIVTPAGRKQFLEILFNNLRRYLDEFDEWVLWANTDNLEDLEYIRSLSKENDFIKHIELDIPFSHNFSISSFFKYAVDPNAVYLRLDDDICFIDKKAISTIFEYRINNTKPFLVYGNIVNNAMINYIQQRCGRYDSSYGINSYMALEYLQHDTSEIAANIHKMFIDKFKKSQLDDLKFSHKWIFLDYERASINAVSWLGKDFLAFDGKPDFTGQVDEDEEEFLSCTMPKRLGRPNEVCGNAIFVHFSFNKQLEYLMNNHSDIYEFYFNRSFVNLPNNFR